MTLLSEPPDDSRSLRREHEQMRRRLDRLQYEAETAHEDFLDLRKELRTIEEYLELAPKAAEVLEDLTGKLFNEVLDEIERNLTYAVQEILGQERRVVAYRKTAYDRLDVSFGIEQNGEQEDIMRGQGGSVCNILSTGLRLIALSRADPSEHRPFLVLDEQDCWLRPSLVPRFMQLVYNIAHELNLQVLVISHHPVDLFAEHADRIYSLKPDQNNGVRIEVLKLPEDEITAQAPCAASTSSRESTDISGGKDTV